MKAFVFALIIGAAIATTGVVSANANTFTPHGVWGDGYGGK